jgi:hypothetical protein
LLDRPPSAGRRRLFIYAAACCATVGAVPAHRRAAHVARLRLIVAADAVHDLAVIRHYQVVQRPFVDVDEFPLRVDL